MNQIKKYLSKIGKKGGSSTSDKKASAAKLNGAKGGRPGKKAAVKPGSLGFRIVRGVVWVIATNLIRGWLLLEKVTKLNLTSAV